MMKTKYDVVILGAGHNGLIAASYLAKGGLSVLILEKNDHVGGATYSRKIFDGVEAYVSEYSYLISLLPQKIVTDLGLTFATKRRSIASFTPELRGNKNEALVIHNDSEKKTRESFRQFTNEDDYKGYRTLLSMESTIAKKVWPTILKPLISNKKLKSLFVTAEEKKVWDSFIEKPLGNSIERLIKNDALRGLVFTDGKIGVHTHPHDPSLLQNRTFLYHVIGNGTGEWRVPIGGMGKLAQELYICAKNEGVDIRTLITITAVNTNKGNSEVEFTYGNKQYTVNARFILSNIAPSVLNRLMSTPVVFKSPQVGSVFKINMLLKRLPKLKSEQVSAKDAFTGTFHLHEGYEEMRASFFQTKNNTVPLRPPGEMYCHSLTDNTILSPDLIKKGYVTLTLFGLDIPYNLFTKDEENVKKMIYQRYMSGINEYLAEPIESCLAEDKNGKPCIEAKTPLDLERELAMPYGNIFHGDLYWPFAEFEEDEGAWGVETNIENVLICGSGARRGGAVSGIPGHNSAMKIFEILGKYKNNN